MSKADIAALSEYVDNIQARYIKKNKWIVDMWDEYRTAIESHWRSIEKIATKYKQSDPNVEFAIDDLGDIVGIKTKGKYIDSIILEKLYE